MTSRYADLRDSLNTGDVVLFQGKGFVSHLIQTVTHSPWSHCGMIVRAEVLGQSSVLVWESTTLSDVPDIEHGHGVKGVQLVSLSKRVDTYPGALAIRSLHGPRPLIMGARFRAAHDAFHDTPYEQRLISLVIAGIGGVLHDLAPRDTSSLFCSEVLCATYAHLFDSPAWWAENPTTWSPKNFSVTDGRVDRLLTAPYFLGPEIALTAH